VPPPEAAGASAAARSPAGAPSIGATLRAAALRLAEAGCDTPRLDAELLLAEALGVGRERLLLDREVAVEPAAAETFASLLARRAEREPVAYILGRREFRRISLRCDPRALIPRPETELLVEVGLELASGCRVLDVGTGSGAVALALAAERPDLTVTGVDIELAAIELARENAAALGFDVAFAVGSMRAGIACDAVLANLPYVADGEPLAPEISRYEPASALYAGASGLDAIERLCADLHGVSVVALEHGFDQGPAVGELVRAAGFKAVSVLPDLAGHERVTVGRR
jgi:release factor glutamine methyltransferase